MKTKIILVTILMCMIFGGCKVKNSVETEKPLEKNEVIESITEELMHTTQIHSEEITSQSESSNSSYSVEESALYENAGVTRDNYMEAFNEFLYEGKKVKAVLNRSDMASGELKDEYSLDELLDELSVYHKIDEYTKISYGFFDIANDGINELMIQACFEGKDFIEKGNFNIICQYYDNKLILTRYYIEYDEKIAISYYGIEKGENRAYYLTDDGYCKKIYESSTAENTEIRMYDEDAYDTCFTSEPEIRVSCYGIKDIDEFVFFLEYENETEEIKNYVSKLSESEINMVILSREELDKLIVKAYPNYQIPIDELDKKIQLEELPKNNK